MTEVMLELDEITIAKLELLAKATNQSVDELVTQLVTNGLNSLADAMPGQLELSDKPVLN